jgi:hypothetical protein
MPEVNQLATALPTATIPRGDSMSGSVACLGGVVPKRCRMPAQWTGGGRDIITFQVSTDNVSFMDLFDADGNEVYATIIPGTVVLISKDIGSSKVDTYFKVRAGSRNKPITQPVDRVFTFIIG